MLAERSSDEEAADQASDVRCVIDVALDLTVNQVITREEQDAAQRLFHLLPRDGKLADPQRGDQRSRESEDCTGSSGTDAAGAYGDAGDLACDAAHQVNQQDRPFVEEALHQFPQFPETPHIEREMHDADVDEGGGEQAPPLVLQSQRAIAGTPSDELFAFGVQPRNAAQDHRQKNRAVEYYENEGNRKGFGVGEAHAHGRGRRGLRNLGRHRGFQEPRHMGTSRHEKSLYVIEDCDGSQGRQSEYQGVTEKPISASLKIDRNLPMSV